MLAACRRWAPSCIALYGTPLIVVDFGTATRFDCVNRRGEFIGGAIAPGINTAAGSCTHHRALDQD